MNGAKEQTVAGAQDPEVESAVSGSKEAAAEEVVSDATNLLAEQDQPEGAEPGADAGQETADADEASLREWQTKRLPFMVLMVSLLAAFFLGASAYQLERLHEKIWEPSALQTSGSDGEKQKLILFNWEKETLRTSGQEVPAYAFEALANLELYTIERRYHQANVLLMSRVWVRYLGFVTGMILALLGATFIIGKMREPPVRLDGKMTALEFSFAGASPGIFLAFVGVVLMITTVVSHHPIEVNDSLSYVSSLAFRALAGDAGGSTPAAPKEGESVSQESTNEQQELSESCQLAQDWLDQFAQLAQSDSLQGAEYILENGDHIVTFAANSDGQCPDIEEKASLIAAALSSLSLMPNK